MNDDKTKPKIDISEPNPDMVDLKVEKLLGPTVQESEGAEVIASVDETIPGFSLPANNELELEAGESPSEPMAAADELPGIAEKSDDEVSSDELPGISEDQVSDNAVDEIVAKESDTALAADDALLEKAFSAPTKVGFVARIGGFFKSWWFNPLARKITLLGVVVGLLGSAIVPGARYFLLNTFGVRASASVLVKDDTSGQPLKNVTVSLSGQTGQTDNNGHATLQHVKLGQSTLQINKRAFASASKTVTIGWGSNPLGDQTIKAVGSQYTFNLKDFLSGNPITKAEVVSGQASAVADAKGIVSLATEISDNPDFKVMISADGYRSEEKTLSVDTKATQTIQMTPSAKSIFISKRSGKYDLYKIDVDTKNEELVLAGTGSERDDLALVVHPRDPRLVALVSTRDNVRNSDGYLMSTLNIIDTDTKTVKIIAQSEAIKVLGWADNRLVYQRIAAGTSAGNPKRFRLMAYNYSDATDKEIAAANYFNDAIMVDGVVFYSVSSAFQATNTFGLVRINADGTSRQTVVDQEVWSIVRTSYDTLNLAVGEDWYENKIGEVKATKLNGRPRSVDNRTYVDAPDKTRSLWIDQRDGKGVLLSYNPVSRSDETVKSVEGISYPIRWLNKSTIIYRVKSAHETADYVLNLEGGEARKIRDVTNVLE